MPPVRVTIDRLGQRGDGLAEVEGARVAVRGALPGETVTIEPPEAGVANLVAVERASPERVAPPCPHVGVCGGCVAQHMSDALQAAWKREQLLHALAQARVDLDGVEIAPMLAVPPASRRRAGLALTKAGTLGFHEARSRAVVPVPDCKVLRPGIVAALPGLARLLAPAGGAGNIDVTVTETGAGLDVHLAAKAPHGLATRRAYVEWSRALGLARLSFGDEILAEFRPPAIDMGGIAVVPPPGAFLQAVTEAEEAMAAEVLAALPKAKRVADLFCGVGTFALRLARRAGVHAVEGSKPALAALDRAARGVPGLKPVTTEARDLYRRPLLPAELNAFDAVVLDPPRQGAEAQTRALGAAKGPRTIVYVSCAPATFARDLSILSESGWKLRRLAPIDQFKWSTHLEVVGVLGR
jgi:23S rRNA (uracil1939-C5)-methyltransferase